MDHDDDAWFVFITGGLPWVDWRAAGEFRKLHEPEDYAPDAPDMFEVWDEGATKWVPLDGINIVFNVDPGSFILLRSGGALGSTVSPPGFEQIRDMLKAVHIKPKRTLLEAIPFSEGVWWTSTRTEIEKGPLLYKSRRPWGKVPRQPHI